MRTLSVKVFNAVLLIVGMISLACGIIGIFLPLLPTTPFLLLSAFCFNKGSKRFHLWLVTHPKLSPPINDWQDHHVIRLKYKILASSMLIYSIVTLWLNQRMPIYGKISLICFLSLVMIFICTRKSKPLV